MDTLSVNICYRPLRICWAIAGGDLAGFRKAVKLSHALWGGRYNPIAIVDIPNLAERVVELFRTDIIVPVSDSEAVKQFVKCFPHLECPLDGQMVFSRTSDRESKANVLDVYNLLSYLKDTRGIEDLKPGELHLYDWDNNDPLSDVFLMHLGAYPDKGDINIDYRGVVQAVTKASEMRLTQNAIIPAEIFDHPSIGYLSRHSLTRHYSVEPGADHPGFYLGDVTNIEDLVNCWNLRAADTEVFFVDRRHLGRYQEIIPTWSKIVKESLPYKTSYFGSNVATWERTNAIPADFIGYGKDLQQSLGISSLMICQVDQHFWGAHAPMMILGESSPLGVMSETRDEKTLSFPLSERPFCGDVWFHSQYLVASLSFIGGLYGDDLRTLLPPYIPELNDFYSRATHRQYNGVRIEPERIGLIISAADSDTSLSPISVDSLFEHIFRLAGFKAKPSAAGLIARQLIAQIGGLGEAGAFKLPGVRRLLKTYGPIECFTQAGASSIIGAKDPDTHVGFNEFADLYLEPRERGTKLRPSDVFALLVEKGLFRIGAKLTCPNCKLASWTSLDVLKQQCQCDLCGRGFDATRQLVDGTLHYRRSGVLGAEKNAQGAIPVVLTLNQLRANLDRFFGRCIYTTSLNLSHSERADVQDCEVDFVWLVPGRYPERTKIIIAECKDRGRSRVQGGQGGTINRRDITNLRFVADSFPKKRFEMYVLLAKLCPFTLDEIEAAKTLNDQHQQRAILLTHRDLESRRMYKAIAEERGITIDKGTVDALARATAAIYFTPIADKTLTTL